MNGLGSRRRAGANSCGRFGLHPCVGVVAFGASIDGSLWYGDLPALDGARDDRHSQALIQSTKGAHNTRKCPVDWPVLYALRLLAR